MTSLVVQTAFLGDVVLTTPLLEALARHDGPLDVVTTPAAAALLATHPAVRRVLPYDKKGKDAGLAGLVRLARVLRAERYDTAYLPHRSLRTAVLARLAGIPRRVGFADAWPFLYTEARPRPGQGHEIDRLLALAGESSASFAPRLVPGPEDARAAEALLSGAGITGAFVALAPGSIWGSKRWSYYADLAARLAARVAVAAVGSADDRAAGEAIVAAARGAGGRAVNACGTLSLLGATALIGRARALVTNDSAPLHLATAVGTPIVALFGPTIPEFGFGPIGLEDTVLGVEGLVCRPCSAHGPPACPLGHHRCMRDLSVDRVLQAVEETGALHRRD